MRLLSIVSWWGLNTRWGFVCENIRTRLSQRFWVQTAEAGRSATMPLKFRMFMLL